MITTRTTTALIATTVLLAIYVFAVERNSNPAWRDFSAIPLEDPAEITGLKIAGPGTSITLERQETTPGRNGEPTFLWRITSPIDDRADTDMVNELVTKLAELKKLENIDDDIPSDEEMGLGESALRITIGTAGGELGTLALGDNAGVVDAIYARWGDGQPFACWQDARELADVPYEVLRDTRILAIPVEEIRRLKIRDETEAALVVDWTKIENTEREAWMITKPLSKPADPKAVQERLSVVANMTALGFIDNPNGDVAAAFAGTAVRNVSIRRHGERGAIELRLARSADGSSGFAKVSDRDGHTFSIDPGFIDRLSLDPNALRDRHLMFFNPNSVIGIQIDAKPDHSVRLLNDPGAGWQLVEQNAPANRSRVARLLKDLAGEEVVEFVADAVTPEDLQKWGLDSPTLSIKLSLLSQDAEQPENEDGSPNLATVPIKLLVKGQVAPPPQNVVHYYATVEGSGTVVRLSPAFPSVVPIRPLDYRSLYLWPSFNLASLTTLKTSRPPQAALELSYLFETNTWTGMLAGEDITSRIDEAQALKLAQELSLPLRATRWITKGAAEAEAQLQQPLQRIEFTLKDPEGNTFPFGLDIAPVNDNPRASMFYARVIGDREVCLIDRATFNLLNAPLIEEKEGGDNTPRN